VNAIKALARLRALGVPVVETADAAAALAQPKPVVTNTLKRLAAAGHLVSIRQGVWWIDGEAEPLRLSEYLSAPYPAYLSLQTALHIHGLIEQIPQVYYVVTLARTQRIRTRVGEFSLHHVDAALFGGFERGPGGEPLATPEKALFDVAYLSGGRSRPFADLPEIELPQGFNWRAIDHWVSRIRYAKRQESVRSSLDRFRPRRRRRR
jgi:predicted transcriptional regulator of viral defense system